MIEQQLRQTCRELLEAGTVEVIIGDGGVNGSDPYPVFITDPDTVDQLVFNDRCFQNLTNYLTRADVRRLGKPAIVVKGCDERAVAMLEKEAQLVRADVYVIGVACSGMGQPALPKCLVCDVHMPRQSDLVLGETANPSVAAETRYAEVDEFMKLSSQERFDYWTAEFARGVRCYACRQVCPLCYCPVCVMDKNRPQVVDTSPHVKGNLAFHVTRAFHLAGRCVGCDECARACPVNINLPLLNKTLARASEQEFGFRPGMDPEADLVTGGYSTRDKEGFIQ
jgi:hypothetical protein